MYPGGLISVDDHIIEPPDIFEEFATKALSKDLPQWTRDKEGNEGWLIGDWFCGVSKAAIAAGQPFGKVEVFKTAREVPRHFSDPKARLKAMDEDGIAMSLCYPSYIGIGGETFLQARVSPEVHHEIIWAYNRFLFERWTAGTNRFIPAIALPLDDIELCVHEVLAATGAAFPARGVVFPESPQAHGLLPIWHRDWDPLWSILEECGIPVCTHTLTDSMTHYLSTHLPYWGLTMSRTSGIETLGAWLLSDVLDRHPNLKVVIAEAGIGWIPWFINLSNNTYRAHKKEFGAMKSSPLEKLDRCIGLTIMDEVVDKGTIESLPSGVIGKLMFEADYPHLDGSYPDSQTVFDHLPLSPNIRPGVARGNARRFFNLTDTYFVPEPK